MPALLAFAGKPYRGRAVRALRRRQGSCVAIAQKIATVLREIDDSLTDEQRAAFYQSLTAVSDRLGAIARTAQPTTAPTKE